MAHRPRSTRCRPASRVLYNPDLTDLWFVIPSLIAMILQVQSISLVVISIVREREIGTMEQILVTPIRPVELLIGKMVPNIVLIMINLALILLIGRFGSACRSRANIVLFVAMALVYIFASVGLGLLISDHLREPETGLPVQRHDHAHLAIGERFCLPAHVDAPVDSHPRLLLPHDLLCPHSARQHYPGQRPGRAVADGAVLAFYTVLIVTLATKTFKKSID